MRLHDILIMEAKLSEENTKAKYRKAWGEHANLLLNHQIIFVKKQAYLLSILGR